MPIKPENRARYPANWAAISMEAKQRAGWRCQHPGCTTGQYEFGQWLPGPNGGVRWLRWGEGSTWAEARQRAAEVDWDTGSQGPKPIVIVLTVAHLNHQPEDCSPENLAAMCQRHHLAHDADQHRANAQATRRAKAGTLELF